MDGCSILPWQFWVVVQQAALIILRNALATGRAQMSALGCPNYIWLWLRLFFLRLFFPNLLSESHCAEPPSAPAAGLWLVTALTSVFNPATLFTPGSLTKPQLFLYQQQSLYYSANTGFLEKDV